MPANKLERTLVIVKPDHIQYAEQILEELDREATRVVSVRVQAVPKGVIEEHYAIHRGKDFYNDRIASWTGRPVVVAVYEGPDVVKRFLELIGPSDPSQASMATIRGRYSTDSMQDAIAAKRPVQNVIHRSDSPLEAMREIDVWQQYLGLDKGNPQTSPSTPSCTKDRKGYAAVS